MTMDVSLPPTGALLDPWQQADTIRQHLRRPDAELVVVIGAEAWCQRCRQLRPRFEALCRAGLPERMVCLWLDLEDHAEFLDGFVPPDLPLLLRWRNALCVQAALVQDIHSSAGSFPRVQLKALDLVDQGLMDPHEHMRLPLPPLWATLG